MFSRPAVQVAAASTDKVGMRFDDSRQVLRLLNEAIAIMAAREASHEEFDWKLQNELRASRNKIAVHIAAQSRDVKLPDTRAHVLDKRTLQYA